MEKMIEADRLAFYYGTGNNRSLGMDSISFRIEQGDRVALVGPSGSGKSTLLAILGGLSKPTEGNYNFYGRDVYSMTNIELIEFRAKKVGFVFQNFLLLPHLSLLENLLVPIDHLRGEKKNMTFRARDLLNQVGIGELWNRKPSDVSGGQAQRAAIARALMRSPALILADEPTGSLDFENSRTVISILDELAESGTTVIVATHDRSISASMPRTINMEAIS